MTDPLERQFLKLQLLLEEIESGIQDHITLKAAASPTESITLNTDDELVLDLTKVTNILKYLEILIIDKLENTTHDSENATQCKKLIDKFKKAAEDFKAKVQQVQDDLPTPVNVTVSLEKLNNAIKRHEQVSSGNSPNGKTKKSKSVRFKESLIDLATQTTPKAQRYRDDPTDEDDFKDQLFKTTSTYSDTIATEVEPSPSEMSNRQLFITNQQELLNQDDIVSHLSESVNRQHELSLSIGGEIEEHLVILEDLESGVNRTNSKVLKGRSNLNKFTRKVKEHGDWCTIFVLIIILVFLLVILK